MSVKIHPQSGVPYRKYGARRSSARIEFARIENNLRHTREHPMALALSVWFRMQHFVQRPEHGFGGVGLRQKMPHSFPGGGLHSLGA